MALAAGYANALASDEKKHTLNPTCTGTSVISFKFNGGVIVAADRRVSYGKMARFGGFSRVWKLNSNTVLAFGGDHADFQFIQNLLEVKMSEYQAECNNPEAQLSPKAIYSWLTWVLYYRRSRINPIYNSLVVLGMQEKEPFVGYVNLRGVAYTEQYLATGMAAMLLSQLLENHCKESTMNKEEAIAFMRKCIDTLFYNDCFADNEFDIAVVTADGCDMLEPQKTTGNWDLADLCLGYE